MSNTYDPTSDAGDSPAISNDPGAGGAPNNGTGGTGGGIVPALDLPTMALYLGIGVGIGLLLRSIFSD